MAVKVRPFEEEDADEILRIYRESGMWFEDIGISREFIVSSAGRPDFRFLVAEDGGSVVGFVGCLYFRAVGRAELGPIGVDVGWRGRGVGYLLADALFGFLKDNGIRMVFVKVKADNGAAIGFFMKLGFWYDAFLRRHTQNGEDIVQLVFGL